MEHSLYAYLSRLTTEQLDQILRDYLQSLCTDNDYAIIGCILEVLKKRDKETPYSISPEIISYWENYRRHLDD